MVSPKKFLSSELPFWYFKIPENEILRSRAQDDVFGKIDPQTLNISPYFFIDKINFRELGYPYISNFKVKRQCWNFPENWCLALKRISENFFVFRLVMRRLENPQWWIWLLKSINIENCCFSTTPLYSVNEGSCVFF